MRNTVLLLMTSFSAGAVVIRDDVPDLKYRMDVADFPALADLPGEGHGVLIADQWVVTAAHAVGDPHSLDVVVVGGAPRAVSRVVIHPGYRKTPQEMVDTALKSGEWQAFFDFMAATDDKLTTSGVSPASPPGSAHRSMARRSTRVDMAKRVTA